MTIGEAAARFRLPTHVLRHWESMGLVSPRRHGDRRRYGDDDLYRIAMVINAKRAGLSLDDIGAMYRAADGESRRTILRQHRDTLRKRIAEVRAALDLVERGIACNHEDITECPNFRRGVAALMEPPDAAA
ncbi:MAG: MerR family transcriptional regulator [Stackebrandtia sp.]